MVHFPFRTTRKFDIIVGKLERHCKVSRRLCSERLHEFKRLYSVRPDEDVIFDFSGGVYVEEGGEWTHVGTLTAGGSKSQ